MNAFSHNLKNLTNENHNYMNLGYTSFSYLEKWSNAEKSILERQLKIVGCKIVGTMTIEANDRTFVIFKTDFPWSDFQAL